MDKTQSVQFVVSAYWTSERHAKATAIRRYRALWRGIEPSRQWSLECRVYQMRGRGISEELIGEIIEGTLNAERPWRLSDAKLMQALRRAWRARRRAK